MGTGCSATCSLLGVLWICNVIFKYPLFQKRQVRKLIILLLEKIAELATHVESLQIEVELVEKQKEPVREQQGSGLMSEPGNVPHNDKWKQNMSWNANCDLSLLHAFTLPGA